jgi:hypothetical protein
MKVTEILTESVSLEQLTEEFDLIESIINRLAQHNGVDAEVIWEDLETLTEDELYTFAVTSEPIMESQGMSEGMLDEAVGMIIKGAAISGPDDQDIADRIAARTGGRVDSGSRGHHILITYPTPQHRARAAAKIRKMFPGIELYKSGGNRNAIDEGMKADELSQYCEELVAEKGWDQAYKHARFMAQGSTDPSWGSVLKYLKSMKDGVAEGIEGSVVFSGTGDNGGKYEIIQSGPNDFMIHANGKHIDSYDSLQRAMSVLQNEVPGLTKGVAEDWQKANKRDKTDGMSQKAVNAYRRENPGSKLKTAVTTKPSKLKKGGKASKRRKSYCSRSRGQMKMHSISCAKTPDKAICKARRRWNC